MTHDECYRLIARVVGLEPKLVHVPSDLLLAMPEVAGTHLKTYRHHSFFSLDAFKADFPGFQWEWDLEHGVRAYIEHGERDNIFGPVPEDSLENRIVSAWREASAAFKTSWQQPAGETRSASDCG